MSNEERRYPFVLITVSIAIAGALMIAIAHLLHDRLRTPGLFEGIGEALLIAGLLAATVDPYLKRRLSEETFSAVLRAALGIDQPKDVQSAIKDIGSSPFVREKYEVDFEFEEVSADTIAVTTVNDFVVRNLSADWADYEHKLWIRKADRPEHDSRILWAKCASRAKDGQYEFQEAQLKAQTSDVLDGFLWTRTLNLAPGDEAHFWGKTIQYLPRTYLDVFYFSHTTLGVRVKVSAPKTLHARAVFSQDADVAEDTDLQDRWDRRSLFLPDMSFVIRWAPREISTPAIKTAHLPPINFDAIGDGATGPLLNKAAGAASAANAIAKVLRKIAADQYVDGEAAGAWGRDYPEYLHYIKDGHFSPDVIIRESISSSASVALGLQTWLTSPGSQALRGGLVPRMAMHYAYLMRQRDARSGGFGYYSARPNSRGESHLDTNLRHTAWAMQSLAAIAPNDPRTLEAVTQGGSYIRANLETINAPDERAITAAVVHRLLSSPSLAMTVHAREEDIRETLLMLERRIVSEFDEKHASWDMRYDAPGRGAIDNALYVLDCIPMASALDPTCRGVLQSAAQHLWDYATGNGLPFHTGGSPNGGSTAMFALIVQKNRKELGIADAELTQLLRTTVNLINRASAKDLGYSWQLASLLPLASEEKEGRVGAQGRN